MLLTAAGIEVIRPGEVHKVYEYFVPGIANIFILCVPTVDRCTFIFRLNATLDAPDNNMLTTSILHSQTGINDANDKIRSYNAPHGVSAQCLAYRRCPIIRSRNRRGVQDRPGNFLVGK